NLKVIKKSRMKGPYIITLGNNWKICSSERISQSGNILSMDPMTTEDWIPATVPSTVLGTLVANRVYEDPYFGENLKAIPTDQFKVPWWYVAVFQINDSLDGTFARLYFDGINHRANIWLNGKLIADIDSVNGTYSRTSFDITNVITTGNNI